MNLSNELDTQTLQVKLPALKTEIWALANSHKGDTLTLLALLRTLEEAHREIRDSLFQDSLPDNRQTLYALLKDIEELGGWPYVARMKLRSLLTNFPEAFSEDESKENA
ncbi:MAG: hypothetical protein RID09_12200 [Coleofasciculus sp. G1-WW12-02]|uniref:hypothetical protein n=1 Tax=Coleofasciculus sp. G1-WW12-02 TaxID=3068483 RepID=UPI0032F94229